RQRLYTARLPPPPPPPLSPYTTLFRSQPAGGVGGDARDAGERATRELAAADELQVRVELHGEPRVDGRGQQGERSGPRVEVDGPGELAGDEHPAGRADRDRRRGDEVARPRALEGTRGQVPGRVHLQDD